MLSLESWTINWVFTLLSSLAIGWVVARTHRTQQGPVVLCFLICDLLVDGYVSFFLWEMPLVALIAQPWFSGYLALCLVNTLARIVGFPNWVRLCTSQEGDIVHDWPASQSEIARTIDRCCRLKEAQRFCAAPKEVVRMAP